VINKHSLTVFVLFCLVFVSAVSVVYITYYQRKLFISLQSLQQKKDEMNIEWGKLQLEENTWSTTSRIEKVATKQLNMRVPKSEYTIFIKLK